MKQPEVRFGRTTQQGDAFYSATVVPIFIDSVPYGELFKEADMESWSSRGKIEERYGVGVADEHILRDAKRAVHDAVAETFLFVQRCKEISKKILGDRESPLTFRRREVDGTGTMNAHSLVEIHMHGEPLCEIPQEYEEMTYDLRPLSEATIALCGENMVAELVPAFFEIRDYRDLRAVANAAIARVVEEQNS